MRSRSSPTTMYRSAAIERSIKLTLSFFVLSPYCARFLPLLATRWTLPSHLWQLTAATRSTVFAASHRGISLPAPHPRLQHRAASHHHNRLQHRGRAALQRRVKHPKSIWASAPKHHPESLCEIDHFPLCLLPMIDDRRSRTETMLALSRCSSRHHDRRREPRFSSREPPAHCPSMAHRRVHRHFCRAVHHRRVLSARCKAAADSGIEWQCRAGLYFCSRL